MLNWSDLELPDEDELAEPETLVNSRRIDATPQPKRLDDEE